VFENRSKPLLSRRLFYRRMGRHGLFAGALLLVALGIGMTGYKAFEGMSLVDAFCNAAMILSGMGPANDLHTNGGKIFAGCYALFSGLAFIVAVSVLLAPALHRLIHKFHLDPADKKK
jgi:hypothetical protein